MVVLTARTRYQSTKCGPRGDDRRRRCVQDANAADAAHTSRAACALAAAAASAPAPAPKSRPALTPTIAGWIDRSPARPGRATGS